MVSTTAQTLAKGNELGHVTRPAKALIGWMTQEEGQLCMAGRQTNKSNNPEFIEKVALARAAVQSRPLGVDQSTLFEEVPAELSSYLEKFRTSEAAKPYFDEGWVVRLADLRKVCALQPVVFWDHAEERANSANPGDISSIAEVTLPIPDKTEIPIQFDPARNTWMITSRNPNLKIVGHFMGPIQGVTVCGFLVTITPSFVQVVSHRDRFLLRDGYHRSLGLLARGIYKVPVLYKEFSQYDDLGLGHGMLQGQAYLGDRPPLLSDYILESVSTKVFLPAAQKMIVVQGMEMNPLG